jgi:hypothetical protein
VTTRLGAPGWPGRPGPGPLGPALADLSGFIGYAAVFALRAPDFSVGLAGRRDLGRCVALFVVPAVVLTLAGVVLHRGTGSDDLVGTLASEGALALGNLLVAASVIAPTFATLYSGTLAVRSITPFGPGPGDPALRPAAAAVPVGAGGDPSAAGGGDGRRGRAAAAGRRATADPGMDVGTGVGACGGAAGGGTARGASGGAGARGGRHGAVGRARRGREAGPMSTRGPSS